MDSNLLVFAITLFLEKQFSALLVSNVGLLLVVQK